MRMTIVLLAALALTGAVGGWLSAQRGPSVVQAVVREIPFPSLVPAAPLPEMVEEDRIAAPGEDPSTERHARQANDTLTAIPVSDAGPVRTAEVEAVEERPLDLRVIQSGHSLTDPLGPALTRLVRAAGGPAGAVSLSTIPGAPMDWRWNHRTHPPDAREDIAGFDVLVLTERVALSNTRRWHNSDAEALRWSRHAWANGADGRGAEVLLYASWVTLNTGPGFSGDGDPDAGLPWRERLDREFVEWEAIMAHVNAHRPESAPRMRMIPATLVMAAIHDAIAEGRTPEGLRDIRQLFSDDIHLSPLGAWVVALTHYTVIFARDPRELPGPGQGVATPEQSAWLQALVWEVVRGYPGSGVRAADAVAAPRH